MSYRDNALSPKNGDRQLIRDASGAVGICVGREEGTILNIAGTWSTSKSREQCKVQDTFYQACYGEIIFKGIPQTNSIHTKVPVAKNTVRFCDDSRARVYH